MASINDIANEFIREEVDWGGRLSCHATNDGQVLAPDEKKHIWGGTLGPGETFSESIALSMDLASRGADDGDEYTMQANYWINLSTGDDNEVDDVEAQASHTFEYDGQ